MKTAIITVGIFLLGQLCVTEAIKCNVCSFISVSGITTGTTNCGDPAAATADLKSSANACPSGFTKCGKGKYESGDVQVVSRFCAPDDCAGSGISGYTLDYSCCTGDQCNGSSAVRTSVLVAFVCFLLALLTKV